MVELLLRWWVWIARRPMQRLWWTRLVGRGIGRRFQRTRPIRLSHLNRLIALYKVINKELSMRKQHRELTRGLLSLATGLVCRLGRLVARC